jgi:cold shock CspA family protein
MRSLTFAFLTADDGSDDVFVPRSVIEKSGLALLKDDAVTFTTEPNPRGPRATSIALAAT